MKTYFEQQIEIIDRKLAIAKQQIKNYMIVIAKNKEQIANLNAHITHLKKLRDDFVKKSI